MLFTADPKVAAPLISAALAAAERVLLLSHNHPDGDAIGSLLGVWHTLKLLGKQAIGVASSPLVNTVSQLPGVEQLLVYQLGQSLPATDLTILVDSSELERTGPIYEEHAVTLNSHNLIVIDHHRATTGPGKINLIDPESASCADLVYRLLRAMDLPLPPETATCLLMGLLTDTRNFSHSNTNSQALFAAAELLEAGADHLGVVRAIYAGVPFPTIKLSGLAIQQMQAENGLYWCCVTQEMLRQAGANSEDAYDAAMGIMQDAAGMQVCALFKEYADGTVKLSLRSVPGINVATIAQQWGGGGHNQAAGATLHLNLTEAKEKVLPLLRKLLQS